MTGSARPATTLLGECIDIVGGAVEGREEGRLLSAKVAKQGDAAELNACVWIAERGVGRFLNRFEVQKIETLRGVLQPNRKGKNYGFQCNNLIGIEWNATCVIVMHAARRFKRKAHRASAVQQQVMGNHPPSSSTAPPGAALPRPSSAPPRELQPALLPHASASFASVISKLPPCAQRWRAHPIRILSLNSPLSSPLQSRHISWRGYVSQALSRVPIVRPP